MPPASSSRTRIAVRRTGSETRTRSAVESGSLPDGSAKRIPRMRGKISAKPNARARKIPSKVAGIHPCFIAPESDARYPPESSSTPMPAPESGGETLKTRSQARSCSVEEAFRKSEEVIHSIPAPMKRANAAARWRKSTAVKTVIVNLSREESGVPRSE